MGPVLYGHTNAVRRKVARQVLSHRAQPDHPDLLLRHSATLPTSYDHFSDAGGGARREADRFRLVKHADELAIRRRDRDAVVVVLHEVVGHLLDRDIRTERAGSGLHHFLGCEVWVHPELFRPEHAEDDSVIVHDYSEIPSGGFGPVAHVADEVLQPADDRVLSRGIAGTRTIVVLPLGRQPCGQPVQLARPVLMDLVETESLAPARGPGR